MNMHNIVELVKRYEKCPNCGNLNIGESEGGIKVDIDSFRRFCKCGYNINIKGRTKIETVKFQLEMIPEDIRSLKKYLERQNFGNIQELIEETRSGVLAEDIKNIQDYMLSILKTLV